MDISLKIDERQDTKFDAAKELLMTQKDKIEIFDRMNHDKVELLDKMNGIKSELTTKIYVTVFSVGLIQLLAIVGAVLTIINTCKQLKDFEPLKHTRATAMFKVCKVLIIL